ncbi:hypothetical protein Pfo_004441 [Paulownia fortunei]|nr:hypothetical protein Pfo_004441 [Paulownia fortunei]
MTILSLRLHPSFTPSPLNPQLFPHLHRLKFTPRSRPPVLSSANNAAAVTGSLENDVIVNGSPPGYYPEEDSVQLPPRLQRELMPSHVAIIMDGNRRWARMRGLAVGSGYDAGLKALRRLVELCCKWGISVLTVFAFSSENWSRPKVETDFLMGLFERGLRDEIEHFVRENIRISLIGDSTKLPKPLQLLLADAVETTQNNSRLHLIVAANYSGQNDVVQACQKIALKVKDGLIEPEDINEYLVEKELETNCTDFPYPDLLIRTSGELRISNFLLWQLAYTELYFTNSFWPEFGEEEFLEALCSFQRRQRRYGRNF